MKASNAFHNSYRAPSSETTTPRSHTTTATTTPSASTPSQCPANYHGPCIRDPQPSTRAGATTRSPSAPSQCPANYHGPCIREPQPSTRATTPPTTTSTSGGGCVVPTVAHPPNPDLPTTPPATFPCPAVPDYSLGQIVDAVVDGAKAIYRANNAAGDAIIDFVTDPDRLETYACGALGTTAGALMGGVTKNPAAAWATGISVSAECSLS